MPAAAPSDVPTFTQAYEAAKETISQETSSAPEKPADVTSEPAKPTSAPPSDEAPAPPPSPDGASPEPDLISEADYQALVAQHPNDPGAVRKELKAVFTRKTQELATQRKALEADKSLLESLRSDPRATLTREAAKYGLTIAQPPAEVTAQAKVVETTASAVDTALAQFQTALGPDLEFLGPTLAPAVRQLAETIAKSVVEQHTGPLKQSQEQLLTRAAADETRTILESFTVKHPDWKQHEAAMAALGNAILPGDGVSALDHLEKLYRLATYDTRIATESKAAVEKMRKAAETREPDTRPTSEARVAAVPPKSIKFRDAYEAAKRGEEW